MSIYIKAPSKNSGVWGSAFHELDINRVDQSVVSDIKVYPQSDQQVNLACHASPKISCILTGYIDNDSDIPGADTTAKAMTLLSIGNEWYYGLKSNTSGFPQYKDENLTYDCGFQKIVLIDEARYDGSLISYQIGLILQWGG